MPPFRRPMRIELEYRRALNALMQSWLKMVPAGSDLEAIFAFLNNGGGERVMQASDRLARGMVTATAVQNAVSWRDAARKSMQGARIYDLLKREMAGPFGAQMRELVSRHASLIRTIPQSVAQDIASQIATRQMRGERAETIAKDIRRRIPEITKSRVAMLARTEVSSTATSISEARARNLSLPAYEWLSSEDRRVRPSHRIMDHVIVFWSDPPAPEALDGINSRLGHYHAGKAPNCRCDANVIVDLNQITFPAKVYHDGRIERMGRARFLKLYH